MNGFRALVGLGFLAACIFASRHALAGGPANEELATGRQLFAEALEDEDHRRYAAALEKYRRVLKIKETPAIHYRMGVTLEALGHPAEATAEYSAAAKLATSSSDADVARASRAKADALEPKVAHLTVHLPPSTPQDAEVRVDDVPVRSDGLSDVRLDPGTHVVTLTTTDGRSARAETKIPEGGHVEIPLTVEPRPETPPPPPPPTTENGSSLRTVGIVTGIGGVVLIGVGAAFLAMRSSAISDLEAACPQGNCPASRRQELTDTHDRAKLDGPLGGTLIGVGAVAVGAGIVLYTMGGREAKAARIVPSPTTHGLALTWVEAF